MISDDEYAVCPNCSGRRFVRDDNGSENLASVPGPVIVRCASCGLKMTKNDLMSLRAERFRNLRTRLKEDGLRDRMTDWIRHRDK